MGYGCKGETKEGNPVLAASRTGFSDSFPSCSETGNFSLSSLELPRYHSLQQTVINWR